MTMAQAPRQRHHRHHRGAPAQRRVDAEEPTRQCPSSREPRETTSQSTGNNLPEAPQDMASLREDLGRILEQTKDLESDKIKNVDDTQQFSQAAQKKLVVACQALSARSSEDVDILSKVVFALFNQDLVKPLPPEGSNRHIIDILCGFFLAALRYEELQECKDKETKKSNVNINNLLTETFERARIDILRALSAVLFEKGAYVKDSLQDLFQMIVAVGGNTRSHEYELRRMALNCMANLVHKTGTLFSSFHERMYEVLLSNLTAISQLEPSSISGPLSTARRKDRGSERKLISSALRALHFLLQEDRNVATRSIPPIISVICRFMFFTSENWINQPIASSFSSAFNAGIIQRSPYLTPNNIIPSTKFTGGLSNTSQLQDISESPHTSYRSLQSSDSEYSDSESGLHQTQRRQHDGKVRLNALLCLQALARAAPKQLQPHWPKFLTSSTFTPMMAGTYRSSSLVGLIAYDPILSVRSAACVVLGNIVESSKQYLAMAEEKTGLSGAKSHAGLLALSERVGLMTREMHVGMALAMDGVDGSLDQNITIQVIKCCSTIVANCSYEKMIPGLSLLLLRSIEKFLDSNEPGLQAATLFFLTTLMSNTSAQRDVRDNVFARSSVLHSDPLDFLSRLLIFVEAPDVGAIVRIEGWSTLRAIAQFHFEVIREVWPRLDEALASGHNSEDIRVRSAGLLFLEEYSKSGVKALDPLTSEWWKDVMERHILKAFAEESPAIKALGCDCISHLSSNAFNGLPDRLEMLIMSLVLGTAVDEHATARAAACRAIGVFILFPSLREDSTHASDMASAVLGLCQDPNLNVRVRASWAVGNLCDSLVLLKTSEQERVLDELLTLALWTKIMKTALLICQDHEKLKSNGIRAIGGLLRVTFQGILERERHSLVKDGVYTLIKYMEQGSLKGRWNACYAMQNVLLNPDFPIGSTAGTSYALDSDMVSWTKDVYDALLHAIQQSKNFKVRINACAALTVPKTRAKYGDQTMLRKMVQVLMTAVQRLDEEQEEHDFGEFQYRGQLETKILRCLDHLLQLTGGVASLELEMDPALRRRIVASRPETVEAQPLPRTSVEIET